MKRAEAGCGTLLIGLVILLAIIVLAATVTGNVRAPVCELGHPGQCPGTTQKK